MYYYLMHFYFYFININNQSIQCFKRKTLKLILISLLNDAYSKTKT